MEVKNYVIVLLILLASCKAVRNIIVKPIMEVLWIPLSNQDLLHLLSSLFHYRQINNKWPGNVVDLVESNNQDSIAVEMSKFNVLHWKLVGDSLLVEYNLQYDYADTIPYKYVSGAFYMLPKIDTVSASHVQIKGERKDGTLRFESNSNMSKKKRRTSR